MDVRAIVINLEPGISQEEADRLIKIIKNETNAEIRAIKTKEKMCTSCKGIGYKYYERKEIPDIWKGDHPCEQCGKVLKGSQGLISHQRYCKNK